MYGIKGIQDFLNLMVQFRNEQEVLRFQNSSENQASKFQQKISALCG